MQLAHLVVKLARWKILYCISDEAAHHLLSVKGINFPVKSHLIIKAQKKIAELSLQKVPVTQYSTLLNGEQNMVAIADSPKLVAQFTAQSAKLGILISGLPHQIPKTRRSQGASEDSPIPRKKRRLSSSCLPSRPVGKPITQNSISLREEVKTSWISGPLADPDVPKPQHGPEISLINFRQHLLISGDGGQVSRRQVKTILT